MTRILRKYNETTRQYRCPTCGKPTRATLSRGQWRFDRHYVTGNRRQGQQCDHSGQIV